MQFSGKFIFIVRMIKKRSKLKKRLFLLLLGFAVSWLIYYALFTKIDEYKLITKIDEYKLITFHINKKKNETESQPFYIHQLSTKNLICSQFFNSNFSFNKKTRISIKEKNNLQNLTCESIKKRRYFSPVPLSEDEENFPLAYSFLVYREYEFLELILSLIYQPQNIYCFAIDKKQPLSFKSKIYFLAKCFENVFVTDKEYTLSSGGAYYSTSHTECIKKIIKYNWKYIFLLQNHDFPMKTNAELVTILKTFQGTSDFKALRGRSKFINKKFNWTIKGLNIFRNELSINKKILRNKIKLGKGYSEVTISREAVNYMLNVLNITTYQNNFDKYRKYGNDEVFWSSLFSNYESLKIPGTLPSKCINTAGVLKSYTRLSIWNFHRNKSKCPSNFKRHSICIFGLEFIKELEHYPQFFVNKLMNTFDAGAVTCWGERIFNRTFFSNQYRKINLAPYLSRLQLRFQTFLKNSNKISKFSCRKK